MTESKKHRQAQFLYLALAGIFISLLVSCNLIFLKFISWKPFGAYTFIISVGLIPYPLTFLVTDLISEIFGEKRANDVVKVGLICAVLVMGTTIIADLAPAIDTSVVSDEEFHKVFGLTGIAVSASMIAYLLAQFIDIKLFHFWKRLTKGKHLWLRNNFSTILSQLVDTLTVLLLLCSLGAMDWEVFGTIFLGSFLFKVIIAALDTPFFYLFTFLIKRHFGLKEMEEIKL
ncbi:MAG: queuosine precursor transporter [Crocinitomicaceae bacterium]|nr:queuosine precursor transporter [Crocinitomicaceae bacterium]